MHGSAAQVGTACYQTATILPWPLFYVSNLLFLMLLAAAEYRAKAAIMKHGLYVPLSSCHPTKSWHSGCGRHVIE